MKTKKPPDLWDRRRCDRVEVQRTEEDLFVEICLEYTFRGAHGENAKIKLLIRDGDVVFKYDILLKFGEQYIISIFLALDLVADIVVNIKNLTAKAQVEDFDLYKAIDAAVLKAATQARKYLDKRQHHKNGETLVELEMKNAEKAKAVSEE